MLLSLLPTVLVQTLMHSLRAKEIFALARCSKWTLECADSAFAWRDCPPLDFRWENPPAVPPARTRFCRWIPLAICPAPDDRVLSESGADRLLTLMQSCSRIVSLGWFEWELSVERGRELLAHSSMQQLRDIGLRLDMRAEWLAAAASLPCLTELNLTLSQLSASELLPLVHARALRKLHVSEDDCECLSSVMRLSHLTTLSVYAARLNADNFVAFCSAQSGLEELRLLPWVPNHLRSISPADLAAGFASLLSLRVLRLYYPFDEETLAPVLHHAPSLRLLILTGYCSDASARPACLTDLQLAAPLLKLQFE